MGSGSTVRNGAVFSPEQTIIAAGGTLERRPVPAGGRYLIMGTRVVVEPNDTEAEVAAAVDFAARATGREVAPSKCWTFARNLLGLPPAA